MIQLPDKKKHPKVRILVYAVASICLLTTSSFAAGAYWLFAPSWKAPVGCALCTLYAFFRLLGGRVGLNKALGDGTLGMSREFLARGSKQEDGVHGAAAHGQANKKRVVVVSDTHNETLEHPVPFGDVLIHCGDLTLKGSKQEMELFLDWWEALPHANKVIVAGNHDFVMQLSHKREMLDRIAKSSTYLENSLATIAGLRIYGSPHSTFISEKRKMAFQDSAAKLERYWEEIPANLDILVTHGPAFGYGDRIFLGKHVGDVGLLKAIQKQKPRFALCGHIHEAYGVYPSDFGTTFINASTCNLLYQARHPPIILDIEPL